MTNLVFAAFLLLSCLFVGSLVNANEFQSPYALAPKQRSLLATQSDVPRTTFTGKKVSSKFCAMDDNGDCHWEDYGQSLAVFAAVGIVLAILSCVCCPVIVLLRYCCNTLGGRSPSYGFCCPNKDDFEDYTAKQILYAKLGVFILGVALLICMAIGLAGSASISKGSNTMTSAVLDTGHDLVMRVNTIGDKLSQLEYTQDIGQQVQDAAKEANSILDQGKSVKNQINDGNKYREIGVGLTLAYPVLLAIIGTLGAIFNKKALPLLAALLCFSSSFFIWLDFGIHLPLSTVVSDVCIEIDDLSLGSLNNSALNAILACNNGGAFQGIRDRATSALNTAADAGCKAIDDICNDPYVACINSTCAADTIDDYKRSIISDYTLGCDLGAGGVICDASYPCPQSQIVPCNRKNVTIEQCAQSCVNPGLRNSSAVFVHNADLFAQYYDILYNEIFPLLNCQFIYDTFSRIRDGFCHQVGKGLKDVYLVSAFMGIFLVFLTFLLFVGHKRFRPHEADLKEVMTDTIREAPARIVRTVSSLWNRDTLPPDNEAQPPTYYQSQASAPPQDVELVVRNPDREYYYQEDNRHTISPEEEEDRSSESSSSSRSSTPPPPHY